MGAATLVETLPILFHRLLDSWPWFVIRGAGFAALLLLILLMLSGIGHITGWTYRYLEPVKAWLVHKWMAYMLVAMVLVHMFTLLIDKYVTFHLKDIFVPFANHYSNQTSLLGVSAGVFAVASGILAFYGIIYVVLTSLKYVDTNKTFWKYSHYVSYAVMVMVFFHALNTGSDLVSGVVRWTVLGLFVLLILAAIARLRRQTARD